ncbi:hypothetical protein CROQUDRAFT_652007 [Cronartium quercuum f. sp. fusiforme G11]|uniref:Tyrosinase copper-binding domain-containing protein n=1 Tax=Cronartium quercuum f. sp. fusiforme G11 TaxID=708437 RepID=A0A9P6TGI4_9BASI|nr:hypothetical protein CROQUDRAFT_652007 [Cronartium quercuum f. sp. fusiforme G11]
MKTSTKPFLLSFIVYQSLLYSPLNALPQPFHLRWLPPSGSDNFLSQFDNQWANFFPNFLPQAHQSNQLANQHSSPLSNQPTTHSSTNGNPNTVSRTPDQSAPMSSPTINPSPKATPLPVSNNINSATPTKTVDTPSVSSKQTNTSLASSSTSGTCNTIQVRKEWRSMERSQQKAYLSAVKCMLGKPSTLQPNSRLRLYDDFESVHDRSRPDVHWVARFLPWHRHFIHLYEQALQSCGYTGALPRWDWSLDAANVTASPVWSSDPEIGFGGNGMDFSNDQDGLGGGTVEDGAFAKLQLLYPDSHLLERGFNSPSEFNQGGTLYGSQYFDPNAIKVVKSSSNFIDFHVALEGTNPSSSGPDSPGPHATIHAIIGGDMSPTSYAANDPIFFLHHANVDYVWWSWQQDDLKNRLTSYGGNLVQGQDTNDASLNDKLTYLGYSPDLTVRDAMDTSVYPYCYRCKLFFLLPPFSSFFFIVIRY